MALSANQIAIKPFREQAQSINLKTDSRLKQAELQEVVDKLTAMENEYEAKKAKKKELEDNINLCKLKLERAEKLLSGI